MYNAVLIPAGLDSGDFIIHLTANCYVLSPLAIYRVENPSEFRNNRGAVTIVYSCTNSTGSEVNWTKLANLEKFELLPTCQYSNVLPASV